MEQVQFEVSAKTARLIGRENISDVDGAIIELIKNSYDADAKCSCILFDMPFPNTPSAISHELATRVFPTEEMAKLLTYYKNDEKQLTKRTNLSAEEEIALSSLLSSHNSIIVIDIGCGMDEATLRTAWMNIGTNDKEDHRVSPSGRIKTGAKGIGRFALDKLSLKTTVYTKSKSDCMKKWQMDWGQFDTAKMLNEVHATLVDYDADFQTIVDSFVGNKVKSIANYEWDSGTIIQLTPTREIWSEAYFKKVNTNLRSMLMCDKEVIEV